MVTFYGYAKCSTCRKAKAYLTAQGIVVREIDITTHPPSKAQLQAMVESGAYHLPELFNRSGELYRQFNMKTRLRELDSGALLDLLARHGRLIKRPIVTDGTRYTVGFDLVRMRQVWAHDAMRAHESF